MDYQVNHAVRQDSQHQLDYPKGYGLMLLALLMLPETKGRAVAEIKPNDMTSLAPSPATQ